MIAPRAGGRNVKALIATLAFLGAAFVVTIAADAQQGRWAAANDPTAKSLIDMERQWVESACTHSLIVQDILADDFQGTHDGKRYSKKEVVEEAKTSKDEARDCRLDDPKVHLFGDNIAVVYGRETATRRSSDGKESIRSSVWTDTWLKRNGTWQIVAAQDTRTDCK
jgi:hypothetical protein